MTKIRVALRVRPLSERENNGGYPVVVCVENNNAFITDIRVPEKPSADSRQRFRQFHFDHGFRLNRVADQGATQDEIYSEMGPPLEQSILQGYNACLLAYGQSGTGKTHTMLGTKEDPGIIPRLCHSLWEQLKAKHGNSFRMEVSFIEIYREKVRDLLTPSKALKLREHPQLGPHVQDLTRIAIREELSLLDLLWEGERRRAIGTTGSNRRSSRSHAIWTVYLTIGSEEESSVSDLITNQVHLVDLAGSEKAEFSTTKHLLAEGADINRSLVSLGNVISSLAEKAQYIPYRDSALTWLLKDSLGGNATTAIIITASPASCCHAQTLNSLRFAQRARLVENQPKLNLSVRPAPLNYFAMSAFDLRKDISRLANLIRTAQVSNPNQNSNPKNATKTTNPRQSVPNMSNPAPTTPAKIKDKAHSNKNGGILRGLAPRHSWNRLISAIEGWNHQENQSSHSQSQPTVGSSTPEKKHKRLSKLSRTASEDATASNSTSSVSSSVPHALSSMSASSTSVSAVATNSEAMTTISMTASTSVKSLSDVQVQANMPTMTPLDCPPRASTSVPASPSKVMGTEVFIPYSSSIKCLTWQQEETQRLPCAEEESSDEECYSPPPPPTPQTHHLKYMLQVHYPTTHNVDLASRISERVHRTFSWETPAEVHCDKIEIIESADQSPVVRDRIITLVDLSENDEDPQQHCQLTVPEVDDYASSSVPIDVRNRGIQDYHRQKPGRAVPFATARKVSITSFMSAEEDEVFDEDSVEEKVSSTMALKSVESGDISSFVETSMISSLSFSSECVSPTLSSSSYDSLLLPNDNVRPIKVVQLNDLEMDIIEQVEELPIDNALSENHIATLCSLEEAIECKMHIDEASILKKPVDFANESKFRNHFARELLHMDQIGREIKKLKEISDRYSIVKPLLQEAMNTLESDEVGKDTTYDDEIERCSGWNLAIEMEKVNAEINAIRKLVRGGPPNSDGETETSQSSSEGTATSDGYSVTRSRAESLASSIPYERNPSLKSREKLIRSNTVEVPSSSNPYYPGKSEQHSSFCWQPPHSSTPLHGVSSTFSSPGRPCPPSLPIQMVGPSSISSPSLQYTRRSHPNFHKSRFDYTFDHAPPSSQYQPFHPAYPNPSSVPLRDRYPNFRSPYSQWVPSFSPEMTPMAQTTYFPRSDHRYLCTEGLPPLYRSSYYPSSSTWTNLSGSRHDLDYSQIMMDNNSYSNPDYVSSGHTHNTTAAGLPLFSSQEEYLDSETSLSSSFLSMSSQQQSQQKKFRTWRK